MIAVYFVTPTPGIVYWQPQIMVYNEPYGSLLVPSKEIILNKLYCSAQFQLVIASGIANYIFTFVLYWTQFYCQAQPKSHLSWAELALVLIHPAPSARPPVRPSARPPGLVVK